MKIRRTGTHYVYIVECADGTYYTGYTPRLRRRIRLHNAGRGARYTRDRRPVRLVWSKRYRYFKRAFKREIAIKKMKRPEKARLVKKKR
jgi:putative endonuclease